MHYVSGVKKNKMGCFNDPDWLAREDSKFVGGVADTTYIQLAGAGSKLW